MNVVVHPLARAEIDGAIDAYLAISVGLGRRLAGEFDLIMEELGTDPLRWGFYEPLAAEKRWRRRMTVGFPFVVIYDVSDESVRVIAAPHASRSVGYWLGRDR
ncbi:MAG: hypothetical protein AAF266_13490 [Planctomycetota bacterium]